MTFLSGFPADYTVNGLHEITPAGLSEYIQNYTNWDLVGVRMNGKLPYSVWDVIRYAFQVSAEPIENTHKIAHKNQCESISVMRCHVERCRDEKSAESSFRFGHSGRRVSRMRAGIGARVPCAIHVHQHGGILHGQPAVGRQSVTVRHHTDILQFVHRRDEFIPKISEHHVHDVRVFGASRKCVCLHIFRNYKTNHHSIAFRFYGDFQPTSVVRIVHLQACSVRVTCGGGSKNCVNVTSRFSDYQLIYLS